MNKPLKKTLLMCALACCVIVPKKSFADGELNLQTDKVETYTHNLRAGHVKGTYDHKSSVGKITEKAYIQTVAPHEKIDAKIFEKQKARPVQKSHKKPVYNKPVQKVYSRPSFKPTEVKAEVKKEVKQVPKTSEDLNKKISEYEQREQHYKELIDKLQNELKDCGGSSVDISDDKDPNKKDEDTTTISPEDNESGNSQNTPNQTDGNKNNTSSKKTSVDLDTGVSQFLIGGIGTMTLSSAGIIALLFKRDEDDI